MCTVHWNASICVSLCETVQGNIQAAGREEEVDGWTGSSLQIFAAGIKPYKHATLSYQSGCQQITVWHTRSTQQHKGCETAAATRASEWREKKTERCRREETNVWKECRNRWASEGGLPDDECVLTPPLPPLLFFHSCHSNHRSHARVFRKCKVKHVAENQIVHFSEMTPLPPSSWLRASDAGETVNVQNHLLTWSHQL